MSAHRRLNARRLSWFRRGQRSVGRIHWEDHLEVESLEDRTTPSLWLLDDRTRLAEDGITVVGLPPLQEELAAPVATLQTVHSAMVPALSANPTQILIIDAALADLPPLPGIEVHHLQAGRNGLTQVSAILAGRTDISALHLLSHGGPGHLVLGGSMIDRASLEGHKAEVAAWASSLTPDADVLLYACDVGLGVVGETFVSRLAELTGADVAASTTPTGAAGLGGDWILEHATGPLEAVPVDLTSSSEELLALSGRVAAWGTPWLLPVPADLPNVVDVAAGDMHVLALKSDGTVIAWGHNDDGNLNLPPGLTNVVDVVAGDNHSLALRADGTVVGWGANWWGQATVPDGLTNVIAIAAGYSQSLALRSDGTVVAWGNVNWVPAGLGNVIAIAAGAYFDVALTSDGTVVAWGFDHHGETIVPPGLANVVRIAADDFHVLALKSDGTVIAWGLNAQGQTSVPANLSNVVQVAAGDWHSLALKADGTVVAWGDNSHGQISVPGSLNQVRAISGGGYLSLAIYDTAPTASPQSVATAEDMPLNLTLMATDPENDPLSYEIVSGPSHGDLTGYGANRTYTPFHDYNGADSFTFRAYDGTAWSSPATVSITVTPVNDAPTFTVGPNITVPEDAGPVSVPALVPATRIYWINNAITAIQSSNRDGSDVRTVLTFSEGQWGNDLQVDPAGGKLYWTQSHRVMRANLDGSEVQTLDQRTGVCFDLALDLTHGKVYYVLRSGTSDTIRRMNLDGTGNEALFDPHPYTSFMVYELAIDPVANKLYFASLSGTSMIERANFDGSDRETLVVNAGSNGPRGLRLDLVGRKIYWTANDAVNSIQRANLDGSQRETLVSGVPLALAFDIDPIAGKMYWANSQRSSPNEGSIQCANLDGSGLTTLIADLNTTSVFDLSGLAFCRPAGWASGLRAGPVNEAGQALSFEVTANSNPALFLVAPSISPDGVLTFTPAANACGSASVTVVLHDDGGTTGSGQDTSAPQTFTITVTPVNDPPVLDLVGNRIVQEGRTLTFIAAANDLEGDSVQYSLVNAPAGASIGETSGLFTWTPTETQGPGIYTFTVRVEETQTGGLSDEEIIHVRVDEAPLGVVVAWGSWTFGQAYVPAGLTDVIQVSGGGSHSLALKSDGTVVAWGSNWAGQSTIPTGLSDVIQVAAGGSHSLALKSDGTVVAWGENSFGQILVPDGLTEVIQVAANTSHSLALRKDGTVVAWGENTYGQATVPTGLSGVIEVAAGGWHSLALKADGTVVAWGHGSFGQTTVPPGLCDVVQVAAGEYHSVALKADGTVVAWGANGSGQTTFPAGLSNVIQVSAGYAHNLALLSDGTVVAWGHNNMGQADVPVGLAGVQAVDAGDAHSLAIRSNRAPIAFDASYTIQEDTLQGMTLSATDPDGDVITSFKIVTGPSHGTLTGSYDFWFYMPFQDYNGTDQFTFCALDNYVWSEPATVSIRIEPVNDAPVLTLAASVSADEGDTLSNSGTYSDVDSGDDVQLSASVGTITWTGTSGGTWFWSMPAVEGPAGPITVTLTAEDPHGGVAHATFTYTITNVAPRLGGSLLVNPLANTNTLDVTRGYTWNSFFSDPVTGKIYYVPNYWGETQAFEYPDLASFASNQNVRVIYLPVRYEGTYHVALDGHLYYAQYGSNTLVKVRVSDGALVASAVLPNAGYLNQSHWDWGGYSDICFYVDAGNVLYVIWANPSTGNQIQVSRLNQDTLGVEQTWTIPRVKTQTGFAFIANSVVYLGNTFASPRLDARFDLRTGVYDTTYSNELSRVGGYGPWESYITHLYWDPATNQLFEVDTEHHLVYPNVTQAVGNVSLTPEIDEGGTATLAGTFVDPGVLDLHTLTVYWDDPHHAAHSVFSLEATSSLAADQTFGSPDGAVLTITAVDKLTGAVSFTVQHAYADDAADPRFITVQVNDDDGGSDSAARSLVVHNVAPVVYAGENRTTQEGSTVSFVGTFTDPGVMDAHTYHWDFGDGTTAEGTLTPSHVYADDGTYIVTLTVADDDNGVGSATLLVTVANATPTLNAHLDLPQDDEGRYTVSEGQFLQLLANFHDQGTLDSHTIAVNWGDGTITETAHPAFGTYLYLQGYVMPGPGGMDGPFEVYTQQSGTWIRHDHSYYDDDPYSDPWWGFDLSGALSEDGPLTIRVHQTYIGTSYTEAGINYGQLWHQGRDAWFVAASDLVQDVDVTDLLSLPDEHRHIWLKGYPPDDRWVEMQWLPSMAIVNEAPFGPPGSTEGADGSASAWHVYGDNGEYTVIVTLTDDDGATTQQSFTVLVGNVAPTLMVQDRTTDEGARLILPDLTTITDPGFDTYDSFTGDLLTTETFTCTIDWGDGSTAESGNAYVLSLGRPGVRTLGQAYGVHTYADNGTYTVTVTVRDDDDGISMASFQVTVNNIAPTAEILTPMAGTFVLTTDYTGSAYYTPVDGGAFEPTQRIDQTTFGSYGAGLGDFDGDGDLDALVGDNRNTWYYEHVGPGNAFAAPVSIDDSPFWYRIDFAEGDFNDDGKLDAVLAHYRSDVLTLYLGHGDGTFTRSVLAAPWWITGLDAADLDGDGALDLVAAAWDTYDRAGAIYVFHGHGDGTFEPAVMVLNGAAFGVSAGDFNKDDHIDVVASVYEPSQLTTMQLLLGQSDGTFAAPIALGWNGAIELANADLNDDDHLDLVYTSLDRLWFAAGHGDGTFAEPIVVSTHGEDLYGVAAGSEQVRPLLLHEGESLDFVGQASDPGLHDTLTFLWSWGDGTSEQNVVSPVGDLQRQNSTSHVYGDDGIYTVALTVRDKDGDVSRVVRRRVEVLNVAPVVHAGADQTVQEGSIVSLAGTFTDPGILDTHTYHWDFGDGTTGTGTQTPRHLYSTPGTYFVSFTVTDDDGGSGTDRLVMTVMTAPSVEEEGPILTARPPTAVEARMLFEREAPASLVVALPPMPPSFLALAPPPDVAIRIVGMEETLGSISGVVFYDADGDGRLHPLESRMAGQTVYLERLDSRGIAVLTATQVTNEEGEYVFEDLPPGTYRVGTVFPSTLRQTTIGDDGDALLVAMSGYRAQGCNFGAAPAGKPLRLTEASVPDADAIDAAFDAAFEESSEPIDEPASLDSADDGLLLKLTAGMLGASAAAEAARKRASNATTSSAPPPG